MRIQASGHTKISNAASYNDLNAPYHEFNNSATEWVTYFRSSATNPSGIVIRYSGAAPNSTSSQFLYCFDTSVLRAEIRSNGGLANYSANNANLSDRNTKKDIAPAADTWDCLKEWEIVNYRYKDQPDDADLNLGVIAQQVAESCPEVITVFQEAKEATETEPAQEERLGVKEQQMMWMAIKAFQEAQLRIETLEAKVAALEA
jgi:outer membrane receptor for monomeric catechols